jgi:spore maturation protein CgeB
MKILIYGEFWKGTLPSLLRDSLESKGFNVDYFDYTQHVPGIRNRQLIERLRRRVFGLYYFSLVNRLFSDYVRRTKPNIIIVSKGLDISPDLIAEFSSKRIILVNWNPDDFFNSLNSNENLLGSFPYYDLIISSRPHLFPEYYERGAKDILFLDWYFVPQLHYKHDIPIKYDISFVGNWSPYREKFISQISQPVYVWGGGWEKSSINFQKVNFVSKKFISQLEMSKIFSCSKFNLNMLTKENRDYSNLRFFEVCASNGLLVSEDNIVARSYLKHDVDCLLYDNVHDINYFLKNEFDYKRIADNGYRKILSGGNTFDDRVQSLIDHIF